MANLVLNLHFYLSLISIFCICLSCCATDEGRKVHIVYMGSLLGGEYTPAFHHLSLLQRITKHISAEELLVRSYRRSFNGFAAKLTDMEAKEMASMDEVVSVFPSKKLQLHTTRSWDFLGLTETITRNPTVESDIIIGLIDTGIWPESESFSDKGFGPPPKKWKGVCHGGKNFTCNNKVIGARYYTSQEISADSARDDVGHGSHTASIAAGNPVKGAGFYGLGQGTARGGVPSARIAAYRICYQDRCDSKDMLAAFDDAIADGVDFISISLGLDPTDIYQDAMAIGAFHAMDHGILTINSAGNSGYFGLPTPSVSPWMLSVAASATDRLFIDNVVLGNGNTLKGVSINSFSLDGKKYPLIDGRDAALHNCSHSEAGLCQKGCLDNNVVKGKIVLCDEFEGNFHAKEAGAAGSVFLADAHDFVANIVSLPASALHKQNYSLVKSYLNSTKNPVAEILTTESIKASAAPLLAPFSSPGPNIIIPDIWKPDLAAPGVEILAAFSPLSSPADDPSDKRQVDYSILSGTSMSCPHAAAIAAYVKSFHPDWSPSAIQSALMTTASLMNPKLNPNAELGYGSGHVNPVTAIDPGLVYEAFKEDYIKLLCSIGYSSSLVRKISGDNSSCPDASRNIPARDLNYPSIASEVPANKSFTVKLQRTVRNVGNASSSYKAEVSPNSKLNITVVPPVLSFKSLDKKISFNVTVSGAALPPNSFESAQLVWSDGSHKVRSPIIIHTYTSINKQQYNFLQDTSRLRTHRIGV